MKLVTFDELYPTDSTLPLQQTEKSELLKE
jgi:hypothetical protein